MDKNLGILMYKGKMYNLDNMNEEELEILKGSLNKDYQNLTKKLNILATI
ncbi:MAG: hypothetical protein PHR25_01785 [Clostridia bacterium]|nr:hypothetical protein [Clostridia bacterium]MDD4375492.1 hypothetical protein [Clostridia bacterium]